MLSETELENFYRILRAEGSPESIELALQIAESNGLHIGQEIYNQLIEISRDIANPKLPDIFELRENGTLLDKIEFVNAAKALNFSSNAQLSLSSYYRHFNEIEKIQCWSLGLQEIPNGIFRFKMIQKLNTGNNKIEKLPDFLAELKYLKELNLFANKLKTFPEILLKIPELVDLQLGANKIETLPEAIGNMKKLEYLGLTDNKIKELPDSFFDLKT